MKNIANIAEKFEDAPRRGSFADSDRHRSMAVDYHRITRWLISHIGQNYDAVCAEFVKLKWVPAEFRRVSFLADSFVETNTFITDGGDIAFYIKYYTGGFHLVKYLDDALYVHPENKTLCFNRRKKIDYKAIHAAEEAKTLRILGDYHQLQKLGGIWYEMKGEVVNNTYWRKPSGPRDRMEEHQWNLKITLKRQLNSKELKKNGLTNDKIVLGYKCPACGALGNCLHKLLMA